VKAVSGVGALDLSGEKARQLTTSVTVRGAVVTLPQIRAHSCAIGLADVPLVAPVFTVLVAAVTIFIR